MGVRSASRDGRRSRPPNCKVVLRRVGGATHVVLEVQIADLFD